MRAALPLSLSVLLAGCSGTADFTPVVPTAAPFDVPAHCSHVVFQSAWCVFTNQDSVRLVGVDDGGGCVLTLTEGSEGLNWESGPNLGASDTELHVSFRRGEGVLTLDLASGESRRWISLNGATGTFWTAGDRAYWKDPDGEARVVAYPSMEDARMRQDGVDTGYRTEMSRLGGRGDLIVGAEHAIDEVELFDVSTQELRMLPLDTRGGQVRGVDLLEDGRLAFLDDEGSLVIQDPETGARETVFSRRGDLHQGLLCFPE